MTSLLSADDLRSYRASRDHTFVHDFTVERITVIQSILLAAFHEWQGNQADIHVSAPDARLALVVHRMAATSALRRFAQALPTGILQERGRGPRFRFDDWKACFDDKRREQLLTHGSVPVLNADGLRIGDDLVSGELAPGRYEPAVIDLFGDTGRRTAFMDITRQLSPSRMPITEVDDRLHRVLRRAVR